MRHGTNACQGLANLARRRSALLVQARQHIQLGLRQPESSHAPSFPDLKLRDPLESNIIDNCLFVKGNIQMSIFVLSRASGHCSGWAESSARRCGGGGWFGQVRLECASLLAPCVAAACCRVESGHFAAMKAVNWAEGPAVSSPAGEKM